MPVHDVVLVTAQDYPALFLAFEAISHDRGTGAGHVNYAVPMAWAERLRAISAALSALSADDFATFCIGEETEAAKVAAICAAADADKLLQEFFEEFS